MIDLHLAATDRLLWISELVLEQRRECFAKLIESLFRDLLLMYVCLAYSFLCLSIHVCVQYHV